MLSVCERVQKGIELLDKVGPPNWRKRIVLLEFSINDPCRCVLGFIFKPFDSKRASGFMIGVEALNLRNQEVIDHGFDARMSVDRDRNGYRKFDANDYEELQHEWMRRLSPELSSVAV